MVYARKTLIHAGLLDTMMTQSHLDNLIETCPQITRNQFVGNGTWVRIPPSPLFFEASRLRLTRSQPFAFNTSAERSIHDSGSNCSSNRVKLDSCKMYIIML